MQRRAPVRPMDENLPRGNWYRASVARTSFSRILLSPGLLGILLSGASTLFAQASSRDQLARSLVEARRTVPQLREVVSLGGSLGLTGPAGSKLRAAMESFASRYVTTEVVLPAVAAAFADNFDEADLSRLLRFFASDLGTHYASVQTRISHIRGDLALAARASHAAEFEDLERRVVSGERLVAPAPVPRSGEGVAESVGDARVLAARAFCEAVENASTPRDTNSGLAARGRNEASAGADASLTAVHAFALKYYPPQVILEATAAEYAKEFPESDLRALVAFAQSDLGKRYFARLSRIRQVEGNIAAGVLTQHDEEYRAILSSAFGELPPPE
jgi:hypothetical protein